MLLIFQRWTKLLAWLLLSTVSALSLAVENNPRLLLDKMVYGFSELNYQGTFNFQRPGSIETLRIAHAVIDGDKYERLEFLNGEKRQIIRHGHKLDFMYPGHQLVHSYQSQPNANSSAHPANKLDQYYRFKVSGMDRVAGRSVINLIVRPRDSHRFGYRLSLDKASGLLLRSELIGSKGQVLERFQFVDITLNPELSKEHFTAGARRYQPQQETPVSPAPATIAKDKSWKVQWLPSGFSSTRPDRHVAGEDDRVTFTDGMTVFSVFLERSAKVNPLHAAEGHAQKGATTAYSRVILHSDQFHRVTVVGEIPTKTARRIARSTVLVR